MALPTWKPIGDEEAIILRSKNGPNKFTRRTRVEHDRGFTYEMRTFEFNFDNGFKCPVPKAVWAELENEFIDRSQNLRYREVFQTL